MESFENEEAIRRLLGLRDVVLAALEELRQAGAIGKSEEAKMRFSGDAETLLADLEATGIDLARFFIVSSAGEGEVGDEGAEVPSYPGLQIAVAPYDAHTCSRCWRRVEQPVDDPDLPDLCERCYEVVTRLLAEGRAELQKDDA